MSTSHVASTSHAGTWEDYKKNPNNKGDLTKDEWEAKYGGGSSGKEESKGEGKKKPAKDPGEHHRNSLSPAERHVCDAMPTKSMDKDVAYDHPKIKAKVKEFKKLPVGTVEKFYKTLQDKMDTVGRALVDARHAGDDATADSIRPVYNQISSGWRAANQALAEMKWEKEERGDVGVKWKSYLPRAEMKKRRTVPHELKEKLERWKGHSPSDPVFKVIDEIETNRMVPHEKLDKAIAHLKELAKDPHHEDDKEALEKLSDELADATGRLKKGSSLRSATIRLAAEHPEFRAALLPLLR